MVDEARVGHDKEDNQQCHKDKHGTGDSYITGQPFSRPCAESTAPMELTHAGHLLRKTEHRRTP